MKKYGGRRVRQTESVCLLLQQKGEKEKLKKERKEKYIKYKCGMKDVVKKSKKWTRRIGMLAHGVYL